jgi:hypothetical protein
MTREMVVCIDGQYCCDRITKADSEKLAADAGLSKPSINCHIPKLAEAVITAMDWIPLPSCSRYNQEADPHEVPNRSSKVAALAG